MDIYSIRNKKGRTDLEYDSMSKKLRVQIFFIWEKFTDQMSGNSEDAKFWEPLHSYICEEHGRNHLYQEILAWPTKKYEIERYFKDQLSLEESFDVIEIIFAQINFMCSKVRYDFNVKNATELINKRFRDNDFGYELYNGIIIRVDNKLLHKELVNKTLYLTENKIFQNANEEFATALLHLKNHQNKDVLTNCLKSFETTMKIIIKDLGWSYGKNDTASSLIQICLDKELIPKYLQSSFSGLRTTLESGIPTIRNKVGGHGQGEIKIIVSDSLARYQVYLTGTCIKYLLDLHDEFKR